MTNVTAQDAVLNIPPELWGGKTEMVLVLQARGEKVAVWTKSLEGRTVNITLLGVFLCGSAPQFVASKDITAPLEPMSIPSHTRPTEIKE